MLDLLQLRQLPPPRRIRLLQLLYLALSGSHLSLQSGSGLGAEARHHCDLVFEDHGGDLDRRDGVVLDGQFLFQSFQGLAEVRLDFCTVRPLLGFVDVLPCRLASLRTSLLVLNSKLFDHAKYFLSGWFCYCPHLGLRPQLLEPALQFLIHLALQLLQGSSRQQLSGERLKLGFTATDVLLGLLDCLHLQDPFVGQLKVGQFSPVNHLYVGVDQLQQQGPIQGTSLDALRTYLLHYFAA